jgi:transposase-like protein
VSSVTEWAAAYQQGTLEAPPPPVAHRKRAPYPKERREAALADYLKTKHPIADVAARNGVHPSSLYNWVKEAKEVTDSMPRERRTFTDEFRYQVAKAVIDGEIMGTEAAVKYDVHTSQIYSWVKSVKAKKLKPPRGKPGPKPKAENGHHPTELVEEYLPAPPRQTTLALPSPRTQLARVTTVHEEIARRDAEIARLKRLLLQTQAMLLDNGS